MKKGDIVGDYRVEECISKGGFGSTYLGYHIRRGTKACLKRCHRPEEEYVSAFQREAEILQECQHESLVTLEALHLDADDNLTIVMPYIEGITLEKAIKGRPMHVEDVLWILRRVLGALAYLHDRGFVHRDVKPANIVVDLATRRATLVDLGCCTDDPYPQYCRGYVVGTPRYMDRELICGPAEPAHDLFALGVTAAQMVGHRFTDENTKPMRKGATPSLLQYYSTFTHRDSHRLPPPIAGVVGKLTMPVPADRPTAAEAAEIVAIIEERLSLGL